MEIATITFTPYRLPFRKPLPTAQGIWQHREGFVICCQDITGKISYGEAAPLPSFGTETLSQCAEILNVACHNLQGQKLPCLNHWWEAFDDYKYQQMLDNLLFEFEKYPAARHGLETAILGLHPINHEQINNVVKMNGLIGAVHPSSAIDQTMMLLNSGYNCLKIKFNSRNDREFAVDRERFQTVMAGIRNYFEQINQSNKSSSKSLISLDQKILLRLDANQSWQLEQSLHYLQILADDLQNELDDLNQVNSYLEQPLIEIEYMEQPVANLQDLKQLTQANILPIAADEACFSLSQISEIIDQKAANILVLKPMVLGGILPTLTAINQAISNGVDVVLTSSLDGAIARFYATSLASYAINSGYIKRHCGLATGNLLAEDLST
ncbi:MAG: enolase C-terminal domain-like protein [Pseudanabaena sp. ELA607]